MMRICLLLLIFNWHSFVSTDSVLFHLIQLIQLLIRLIQLIPFVRLMRFIQPSRQQPLLQGDVLAVLELRTSPSRISRRAAVVVLLTAAKLAGKVAKAGKVIKTSKVTKCTIFGRVSETRWSLETEDLS